MTYWDNGFYIARALSACGGKSEHGLNVAAPECTMVGKRIVVCALQATRCKQIGVSMAASAGRFRPRQELLRQIAVPMEGVDFAS
jgi:hypothetical protein